MLELLSKDASVGNRIKIYLISGEVFEGTLDEIGSNYVLLDVDGIQKRLFVQMIGGWDVLNLTTASKSKTRMPDLESTVSALLKSFDNLITESDLSIPIEANALIKNVSRNAIFVKTNDNPNLGIPFTKIGDNRMIGILRQFHGEELSVYVQTYFDKKKLVEIPTIVIMPGSVRDVLDLLRESINKSENYLLSVNLCHVILKHISNGEASRTLWNLVKELKRNKSEEKQNELKDNTTNDSSVAAMINRLATWGKTKEALELIQKEIDSNTDDLGYISSLLLRKAQLFSSINDYVHSKEAYEELIQFQEEHKNGSPEGLSHYYTELARLLIKLDKKPEAISAIESAIRINANNNAARNLLYQLTDEKDDSDLGETKEHQDTSSEIDRLLQSDLESFDFTDAELLATNGVSTLTIANRLLETARQEQSTSAYLEAAKAFYVLNVGSYSVQDLYDALYGYVRSKALVYYNSFFNALSGKFQLLELRSIIDSAICYFKESIKIGPAADSQLYLWNSIRLSVSYAFLEKLGDEGREIAYFSIQEKSPDQLLEIIKKAPYLDPSLAMIESVIDLCADYPTLWSYYHNKQLVIPLICNYIDEYGEKNKLLGKLFTLERNTNVNPELPSEIIISQLIKARSERIKQHQKRAFRYLRRDVPLMVTDTGIKRYRKMVSTMYVVSPTEQHLFTEVTRILTLLSTFYKRTETEQRTISKNIIDDANSITKLTANRPNFYSVTFFKPLLSLVVNAATNINTSDDEGGPIAVVGTDTGFYQVLDKTITFDLTVENQGSVTIDGFILTLSFPGTSIRQVSITRKRRAISPGSAITIPVSIVKNSIKENALDITCSIICYYLTSKHIEKSFQLTIIKTQETSLDYQNVKWEYGRTETRGEMFKGREGLLSTIREHFSSNDRSFTIVLFGLSRTGKSSILENFQMSSKNDPIVINGCQMRIAPIFLDLADLLPKVRITEHSLKLDRYIAFTRTLIQQSVMNLSQKGVVNLSGYPDIDYEGFINYLNESGYYPVFMFDEFSYMKQCIDDGYLNSDFLHNLRSIAYKQSAGFIYSGTYDINALIYNQKYNISASFVNIKPYKIGKIEKAPAEELINAMRDKVSFSHGAIEQIHLLSGDIPYWIQVICKNCAGHVISTSNPAIGLKELDDVVKIIIGETPSQSVSKLITNVPDQIFRQTQLLDSDPPKERDAILTGLAYLIDRKGDANKGVSWLELNSLWQEKNYKPNKENMKVALENLLERDTIMPTAVKDTTYYRFSVDIFRKWWGFRHRDIEKEFDLLSS